jgi:hypothetical protein
LPQSKNLGPPPEAVLAKCHRSFYARKAADAVLNVQPGPHESRRLVRRDNRCIQCAGQQAKARVRISARQPQGPGFGYTAILNAILVAQDKDLLAGVERLSRCVIPLRSGAAGGNEKTGSPCRAIEIVAVMRLTTSSARLESNVPERESVLRGFWDHQSKTSDREELKSGIVPMGGARRANADRLMHGAGSIRESHKGSETLYAAVTAGTLAEAFLI